jgi:hypothetical protein
MDPARFSDRRLFHAGLALLALFVLAGITYSCLVPTAARFPDENDYRTIAGHVIHEHLYSFDGVHPTAGRPPGYPFFLVPIEWLGGGVIAMRIANFFLAAGTILLACRLMPGPSGARLPVVMLLVIFYAVLFYTAGTLYPQTLGNFLFIASLVLLLEEKRGPGLDFITGAAFGALLLTVPTFAFTLILLLAAGGALKLAPWRTAVIVLLVTGLMIGLWTARNAVVFHHFVPMASNSGQNFLVGNNPNATPFSGAGNVNFPFYEQQTQGLDEIQRDDFYRRTALRWIAAHPARAAELYLGKTLNFFNVWNEFAPTSEAELSLGKQIVMAASYLLLLGLLGWRLWDAGKFPLSAREKLFLFLYVTAAFTTAIFFTRIRYRLAYDYLLIGMIAAHLQRRWAARQPTAPS